MNDPVTEEPDSNDNRHLVIISYQLVVCSHIIIPSSNSYCLQRDLGPLIINNIAAHVKIVLILSIVFNFFIVMMSRSIIYMAILGLLWLLCLLMLLMDSDSSECLCWQTLVAFVLFILSNWDHGHLILH